MVSTRTFFRRLFWWKISSVAVLQVSPLLTGAFTFKIIAPPSLNPLDPLYYLQYKFIERNCKATLKQLVYLHASLLKDNTLHQLRTWRTTGYIGYILRDYVLKLILVTYISVTQACWTWHIITKVSKFPDMIIIKLICRKFSGW